jgi:hypothetical protein
MVRSQSRQVVHEALSWMTIIIKKGWWCGSRCRPWVQTPVPPNKVLWPHPSILPVPHSQSSFSPNSSQTSHQCQRNKSIYTGVGTIQGKSSSLPLKMRVLWNETPRPRLVCRLSTPPLWSVFLYSRLLKTDQLISDVLTYQEQNILYLSHFQDGFKKIFLSILKFGLRASHLLSKCSTTWPTLQPFYA